MDQSPLRIASMIRSNYRENIPSSVEEKISKLGHQQALVRKLEQQLYAARLETTALENDFSPYINYKISKIDIAQFPADLLIEIFKIHLGLVNHRRIRSLLLVCRPWHRLIVSTPSLWATIDAVPTLPSAHHQTPYSHLLTYIETCLERSRTNLLDINLDYSNIARDADDLAALQIQAFVQPLIDEDDDETSYWFQEITQDRIVASESIQKEYELLRGVFPLLVGLNGIHCSRWRSFKARLARWYEFHREHPSMLKNSCPNLTSIDTDATIWELGDMPSLKTLKIYTLDKPILDSPINATVERLLVRYVNSEEINSLADWRSLRELCYAHKCYGSCFNSSDTISLPNLQKLVLCDYNHECCVRFELPRLEHLKLQCGQYLPDISVPSLSLDLSRNKSIEEDLKCLIYGMRGVQHLAVVGCDRSVLQRVLKDAKTANALTPTLQIVKWTKDKGDIKEPIAFTPCTTSDYRRRTRSPYRNIRSRYNDASSSEGDFDM